MTTNNNAACTNSDIMPTMVDRTDDDDSDNNHSDDCRHETDDRYNDCYRDWGDGDQYDNFYDYDTDGYYGDMTDKYRHGPEFQRKDLDVIMSRFKERRSEERNAYKNFNTIGPVFTLLYSIEYDKIRLSTTHVELNSILQELDRIIAAAKHLKIYSGYNKN